MELFSQPGFWLLAAFAVISSLLSRAVTRGVEDAERDLTADELKTFREDYVRHNRRSDMLMKYQRMADAQDRARRFWLVTSVLLIAILMAYIYLGPNLGLPL